MPWLIFSTSTTMPDLHFVTSSAYSSRKGLYGDGQKDPNGSEKIAGFKPVFSLTDAGLHWPKIIECIGSKGNGTIFHEGKGLLILARNNRHLRIYVSISLLHFYSFTLSDSRALLGMKLGLVMWGLVLLAVWWGMYEVLVIDMLQTYSWMRQQENWFILTLG